MFRKKQFKEQKFIDKQWEEYDVKTICNLYIASYILQILKDSAQENEGCKQ